MRAAGRLDDVADREAEGGESILIAVDVNPAKLGLARQLGADHAIDAREPDHLDQIRDLTGGGVDVAIELAGSVKALETGYGILRTGGTLVTAGLAPAGATLALHAADLVTREITVKGSYMGSCVPVRDIPRFLEAFPRASCRSTVWSVTTLVSTRSTTVSTGWQTVR